MSVMTAGRPGQLAGAVRPVRRRAVGARRGEPAAHLGVRGAHRGELTACPGEPALRRGGTAGVPRSGLAGGAGRRARLTRRGRMLVMLLLTVALVALAGLAGLAVAARAQASGTGTPAGVVYRNLTSVVVRPGQSLWSIASQAQPHADPRIVVRQIVDLNALGGPVIEPGERLWVPRG